MLLFNCGIKWGNKNHVIQLGLVQTTKSMSIVFTIVGIKG